MSEIRAVVDRIEDQMAVVLVGDESQKVTLQIESLPAGVREGDVLTLKFEIDTAATLDAKKRVQAIVDKLGGGESAL
jgi:hypothetical protein